MEENNFVCGLTNTVKKCVIKTQKDGNGISFFINDINVLNTKGKTIPIEQLIIIEKALNNAYNLGFSDASKFIMNKK